MSDQQHELIPIQAHQTVGAIELVATPVYPQPLAHPEPPQLKSPSKALLGGGIVGGLTLMGVGAGVAVSIFQMAPSALSIAAYAAMAFSLVRLWPSIAVGMVNIRTPGNEIVLLSPAETLEAERQRWQYTLQRAQNHLESSLGVLEALKELYKENHQQFSPQKQFQWEIRLQKQEQQLNRVGEALEQMGHGYRQVEQIMESTKAELSILEAGPRPSKTRRAQFQRLNQALNQMRSIESQAISSFNAALQAYQQLSKESL